MRQVHLLLMISVLFLGSCKFDSNHSYPDEENHKAISNLALKTISGEFIHSDSVAVFNNQEAIYGVVMNAKAKKLIAQVREINSNSYASFDVTLEVLFKNNTKKDAWPQVIDIQNIINVKPSAIDDGVRLNKQE